MNRRSPRFLPLATLAVGLLAGGACGDSPSHPPPAGQGGNGGRGGSGWLGSGGSTADAMSAGGTGGSGMAPHDGGGSVDRASPADGSAEAPASSADGSSTADTATSDGAGTPGIDAPVNPGPGALLRRNVKPKDTDPAIDKWLEDHVAVVDTRVPGRGKLFLFLAGGNGVPSSTVDMLNVAAGHGFHTIGLRFANTELVGEACPSDPDPNCAGEMRTEVIEGTDLSPHLVVSPANSIENRLGKALAYLHRQHPTDGWSQYLEGTAPRWSSVIASGRSLGGAIAARMSQLRLLHRVQIHSAPGDDLPDGQPAPWLREPRKTPAERIFAFSHTADPDYASFVKNWAALGIPGPPTSVDGAQPPYGDAHQLITSAPTSGAHGSTTAGGGSPQVNGAYRYAPVWRYMMGVP